MNLFLANGTMSHIYLSYFFNDLHRVYNQENETDLKVSTSCSSGKHPEVKTCRETQ